MLDLELAFCDILVETNCVRTSISNLPKLQYSTVRVLPKHTIKRKQIGSKRLLAWLARKMCQNRQTDGLPEDLTISKLVQNSSVL